MHRAHWRQAIDDAASAAKQQRNSPTVRPINLSVFIESAFEGTNEDVNVGAAADVHVAGDAITDAIVRRFGRPLTHPEFVAVLTETGFCRNRRAETRRAQLAETQRALHNPMAFA